MNFTDDSRLIVSGFAFLEFAPLECFSQKCIEDLEIGSSIDDYFFSSTFFFGIGFSLFVCSRKFLLRKHCFMLQ